MKFQLPAIVLILLFSCRNEDKLAKLDESTPLPQKPAIGLVDQIAMCNRVDGPFVGIGAVKSEQYKRYELLSKYSEEKLIELTKHKSPAVKVYAFNALFQKKSSKIISIFAAHITDTTEFEELAGCIGMSKPVNFYLLQKVEPLLTSNQKAEYIRKVSSYYSKERWEMLQGF